ncbi:zinc finger, CCHC-type containing protein [Tanacetum coccineum]
MDVKTAFLNVPLKEEVYVAQPDGFVDLDHPEKVYRLRKALYRLKQGPRAEILLVKVKVTHRVAPVHGKGSVVLEFSSGKSITLFKDLVIITMHARLEHVHCKRMLKMSKDDLIPAIDENPRKCTTCMLTKITRRPFKSITRKYVILELIHSDLCDFHATPSLGNKKAVVRLPDPKRKTLGEKESIDAIFDENHFSSLPRPKDIIPNSVESQRDDHFDDVPNETPEPRKDAAFWKEAIDDEIGSIMENSTWVLSDLPPGCKPFGCKWIFKRKMKVDETIDKFKARLVIHGFRQKEGIDYFDTYAPVARITIIRLLLALAAIHNLVIYQMDVKTAFLKGDLEEEVYMKQPEGFVIPGNEHNVCKLVKSLYGLKQYVYSKFDSSNKGVIICLYVDDMLIFGTDQNQVDKTKKFLSSKFSMKDMGEADVILGIKIKCENKGIVITQSHYIEKILKKFNREDCSSVSTPIDLVEKLKSNTGKHLDQLEYSKAIGCLMYAMTSTSPDIAYAVSRLSRFTSNPSRQHWHAITGVFKYWKGTMNYGLSYVGYPSLLEAYSDASKKQTCITGSTMESEFATLAAAGKEVEWLRNMMHEIPI